ncbi:MAG: type II toxin-antitoxin system RelE/ParE family toxin [Deltaproteobacteria bacterium]|nr:type II toxin-antitoxin system RelE/ParE family toxin [Deltaproteobacteria bacterium]MDP2798474.1 type II toxin-antitoxin system RelE/ParE family toxin [Deltaproteobacteria bacterium]MDP3030095.1 type II toxin-antitoxin system RelE/ParE family toxin [Deltaproteobacteria bacterium]
MNFSIWFHPDAEAEINEASTFLDIESRGLGVAFLDDVQHAIEVILSHPEISPIIKGRVRRKVLWKFPYSIIYSVAGNQIRILAVSHQRRRPFYWRHRK